MNHPDLILGAFPLEASTEASIARFFKRVGDATDRLSGIVNCIGPILESPLSGMSGQQFETIIQGNLMQAYQSDMLAIPFLEKNKGGQIIHFTFAGVEKLSAYREIAAYAAAKAGLLSLIRSLAVEMAHKNITVNAIAPGVVETAPEEHHKLAPGGKLIGVNDIFSAVDFLMSGKASKITGVNLSVSNGMGW